MSWNLINPEDIDSIKKGGSENLAVEFTMFWNIIIPAIGQLIAKKRGWIDFDKKARTIFFSPRCGQRTISLPFANLLDTPTPQVWQDLNSSPVYGADTALVYNEDFTINKRHGWLERRAGFAGGVKSVKVTITGGYFTQHGVGAPEDLRAAAAFGALTIFQRRDHIGLSSQSLEGGGLSFLTPLLRAKDFWDWSAAYQLYPDAYDE